MDGGENLNNRFSLGIPENTIIRQIQQMNKIAEESNRLVAKEKMDEVTHRQNVETLLEKIVENTANLNMVVELLNDSNSNQKLMLDLIREALEIGTSSEIAEAETKYKGFMGKVIELSEGIEASEKLLSIGKSIYHTTIAYIKHRIENGE